MSVDANNDPSLLRILVDFTAKIYLTYGLERKHVSSNEIAARSVSRLYTQREMAVAASIGNIIIFFCVTISTSQQENKKPEINRCFRTK